MNDMSYYKISLEVAEADFNRFCESMAVETDLDNMEKDTQKAFLENKCIVIKAMRLKSLAVNESGELEFTPVRSDNKAKITFHEPTGATLMATDGASKNESMKRMNKVLADVTQTNEKRFSLLKLSDYRVCLAVISLFLV